MAAKKAAMPSRVTGLNLISVSLGLANVCFGAAGWGFGTGTVEEETGLGGEEAR